MDLITVNNLVYILLYLLLGLINVLSMDEYVYIAILVLFIQKNKLTRMI